MKLYKVSSHKNADTSPCFMGRNSMRHHDEGWGRHFVAEHINILKLALDFYNIGFRWKNSRFLK
ncbi:hypothetical protein NG55_12780 [Acinetobacter gyllenbergii]|nr:hypothetical protein NG55_12780 [Acinetobacter gyllenbergii]